MSRRPKRGPAPQSDQVPARAPDPSDADLGGSLDGGDDQALERDADADLQQDSGGIEILEPGKAPEQIPDLNPFHLKKTELRYCHARAIGWNKKQAAEFAGLAGGSSSGAKLEQREGVLSEIARLRTITAKNREPIEAPTSGTAVLDRWWELANANYIQAWNLDGEQPVLKRPQDMPLALQRSIKKFIFDAKGNLKDIELHNPLTALEKISGYMGLRLGAGAGPWGDAGGSILTPGGDPDDVPEEEGAPTRSLTFEERVAANGDRIRATILKQTG